jgi:DNA repair protein RadC
MKKAKEFYLTCRDGEKLEQTEIKNSKIAAEYCRNFYFEDLEIYESFFLMMLNPSNAVIAWAKIAQGGVSATFADPKIIAKYAIDSLCSNVILCHNHPSGNKKPSEADKNLTRRVKEGLLLFDIKTLDHIILTKESYYSFSDDDLI